MKECVIRHGVPEIVNTDQGSQYTSPRWGNLLQEYGVKTSMDGRGRCKDNIWIERFWRTIKQEAIYINPTDSVVELRTQISNFIDYYNTQRPHQSLGGASKKYFPHSSMICQNNCVPLQCPKTGCAQDCPIVTADACLNEC